MISAAPRLLRISFLRKTGRYSRWIFCNPSSALSQRPVCDAFGFNLRIRIGDHRAQLNVSDGGAVVLIETAAQVGLRSSVMVRVENADKHYDQAQGMACGSSRGQPTIRTESRLFRYLHSGLRQFLTRIELAAGYLYAAVLPDPNDSPIQPSMARPISSGESS